MKRSEAFFGLARIPLDILMVSSALVLAYHLRVLNIDLIPNVQLLDTASTLPNKAVYLHYFIMPSILVFVVISGFIGLYALQATRSAWNEVGRILIATLLWLVAVMTWFFLIERQLFFSRILLIHSTVFIALFVIVGRACVTLFQRSLLRTGIGVRYVASVGKQRLADTAKRTLARDARYAYLGHVASLEGISKLSAKQDLDLVLQTDPNPESDGTLELIDFCRSHHIGYAFLPPVFTDVPHQLAVERLGLLPMIRFQPTPLDGWGRVFKRLCDIVASIILIIILSPFMLMVAIAILIDSGWPVFYVSKRVGEQGRKRIGVIKFRSMVRDADRRKAELMEKNHRVDGPLFKMKNDPRITRVGHFIRRWSIDEWPQLFNVLAGHMSLVGPRPHLPEEVKLYTSYQRRVFAVRPGITGLAQISGRSDLKFDEEVALDLKYVEEWTLFLDLWILWRTLVVVFSKEGAD
ncbi:MAG TPA: sugar transferase [Candidatus Peribacteraceae bacterium]|nr:sugar transferase [Candidatus Peribacteraceae bacterium]